MAEWREITDGLRESAIFLWKDGLDLKEIARQTGLHPYQVSRIVLNYKDSLNAANRKRKLRCKLSRQRKRADVIRPDYKRFFMVPEKDRELAKEILSLMSPPERLNSLQVTELLIGRGMEISLEQVNLLIMQKRREAGD